MTASSTKPKPGAFAKDVAFDNDMIHVTLADGRRIGAPLEWFPKLRKAGEAERKNWRLVGKGMGVHWDALNEDVWVAALLEN